MIRGLVTIDKVALADGRSLSTQQAVDYGWIRPGGAQPTGWGLARHEVPLGENTWVDQGRQLLAYLFGFRAPVADYACQKFGVGTGLTAAQTTDVALEAPITLSGGGIVKAIDFVDFVSPYAARVSYTLGVNDANGYIISEIGLFSGNNTLMARKVQAVSINKVSDFAVSLLWHVKF